MPTTTNGQEYAEIQPDESQAENTEPTELVNDVWIADQLRMKVPTIRSQRHKRRKSLDHWFDVDPVFIGAKPRYRRTDVMAWLKRQASPANSTAPASGRSDV